MKDSIFRDKSYTYAKRIVRLSQRMIAEQKEFVLSRQLLRSGTAIGALFREVEHGRSKAYLVSRMNIALKETTETNHWLSQLKDSGHITPERYDSYSKDAKELVKLLSNKVNTIKTESSIII